MIVLVCGGRDWTNGSAVFRALDALHVKKQITMVIQGGARGADTFAKTWASRNGIHCAQVDALWKRPDGSTDYAAGPRRNRAMLLLRPDAVIAFPGGNGTADMIAAAKAANVRVWEPVKS